MGLGLRAEQAPVARGVEFRSLLGKTVSEFISLLRVFAKLNVIGVADHVVMKTDTAHASALHRQRLQQAAAAALEPLGADDDFFSHRRAADVDKSAVVPVAMRKEYAGYFAGFVFRPIEIAGHKESRHALKIGFLDRVIAFVDAAV